MPHAVFPVTATATGDITASARALIPGVEPGGSRAGKATKPALLIRDCFINVIDVDGGADDVSRMGWYLKLSQERDLSPGLHLPIGYAVLGINATPTKAFYFEKDVFHAQGTIWAPAWIGIHTVEQGTIGASSAEIHLDYERIDVPWMDWFIMWEFLDNITDGALEY